jgi:DNA polymerase III subunit gamma/tau
MSLYQKVRPTSFSQVVGNEDVVRNLKTLTTQNDPPHAFLLTGPSGCGKTTLGRLIAFSLGADGDDFDEIDSADFRGIDTIRDIRRGSQFMALQGSRRAWLLDEIHALPKLSQDALLKGLEDPPSHAFFIMCTTVPEALSETLRSRCSIHKVSPLTEQQMVALLHRIASGEGERLSKQVLRTIFEKTDGKPRAAINLLEKVLASEPDARDAIVEATESVKIKTESLARELIRHTGWKMVSSVLTDIPEEDVESVRRGVLGYASKVLLSGENDYAASILDQFLEPFFNSGKPGLIHACYCVVRGEGE